MANVISAFRILLSATLIFFPAFSVPFYVLYLAAGLSDILYGAAARMTNTVSGLGEKLDTAADIAFFAACLAKLLPAIAIPVWLYIWTGLIALIKIINIASGYVTQKHFVALHTFANKAAGILLFALPLTFGFIDVRYSAIAVCAAATFAAVQEGHLIRTGAVKQTASNNTKNVSRRGYGEDT